MLDWTEAQDEVATSPLTLVEFRCMLARRRRARQIDPPLERVALAEFDRDVQSRAWRIQSVELFETRPVWDNPSQKMESPVAKATYVKTQNLWKTYWMRADLKCHSYPPAPEVNTLDAFLALVAEDKHACFFG